MEMVIVGQGDEGETYVGVVGVKVHGLTVTVFIDGLEAIVK